MRNKAAFILCLALIFVFDFPLAHAAQTFYLPRQFSPAETGTIGIALVNPVAAGASATFRWRTADGAIVSTTQRAIPAKGQVSVVISQLFPDLRISGWLSVDIDIDQVTGFWLGGDFINSADGAPLLNARSAAAFPAFTFLTSTSEISFVNAGSSKVSGFMSLFNSSGINVINVLLEVPAFGIFQQPVASLFPAYAAEFDSSGYWVRVNPNTSDARLVGTTVTPGARDNIVTNAVVAPSNQFLFPHVVGGQIGGATYDTQLSVANVQTAPQDVTLTLRQTSGAVLTAQRSIPGTAAFRASITSLFNVTSVDGWLLVTTSGGNVAGLITYADLQGGGTAAVDLQAQPADTNLVFGHIAELNPWRTGIALVNSSNAAALVEVYAIDSAGNLIGGPSQSPAASFTIAGQSKRAFLLGDVIPATQTRTIDGGYVYVRSTNGIGLYGTELLFLRSGRVYSSVPAASLAGTTFSLPTTSATNTAQVSIAPSFISLQPESTWQFLAAVTGTANTAVTWSVNNIAGGNSEIGTISASGLYTAPRNIPDSNPLTIRAASTVDVTKSATAGVIVIPAITSSTARFLTITSAPPPAATAGSNYLFNFTAAGGRAPYTWSITSTESNGLTLNSSTGILTGIPLLRGSLPLNVEVTDADGLKETVQYDMSFTGPGSSMFITNTPTAGTEATFYFFRFTTSWTGPACAPVVRLISGSLPPGVVLDGPNMILSGTPLIAGSYTFTVAATGGNVNCLPAAPVRTNAQTMTMRINSTPGQSVRGASNWTRGSDAAVLTPTPGTWDGFSIRSASVVTRLNDIYRMYYEGEDSQTHTRQIGLATSLDGVTWSKSATNPILRPGPAGSKDAIDLRSPAVHFDGATYRMWYAGIDDRDGCAWIQLATSTDGIAWTKSPSNPLNLSNCDYSPGTVIKNADTFMMWYSRKLGGIGLATSTDGIRWTDLGTVIANPENITLANPAVVLDSQVYRMWFEINNTTIGFASSTDGINWTVSRDSDGNTNVVFASGQDGAWDRPGTGQPSVIIDPNVSLLKMWYTGGPVHGPSSIGYAR
jgi:hypothetical protein